MPSWTLRYAWTSIIFSKQILDFLFFFLQFFFFFFFFFCRVSSRVAFTRRESFKNCRPQSGAAILKLFFLSLLSLFSRVGSVLFFLVFILFSFFRFVCTYV